MYCRAERFRLFKNFKQYFCTPLRSVHVLDINVSVQPTKKMTNFNVSYAIIRHDPGTDKYSFSFMLNSGKLCNFNRSALETIATFEERMAANLVKKYKTTEITAKIVLPPELKGETSMRNILDQLLANSLKATFQINDDTGADVVVNPPEINTIKFYKKAFVGFPVLPCKIDASSNFVLEKSQFQWKATFDPTVIASLGKPNKGNITQKFAVSDTKNFWKECGSNSLLLVPNEDLEGSLLRLICTPSDGESHGIPYIAEFPSLVTQLPVPNLLYEERLARMTPNDSTDPTSLRIVTYNILADTYATPEWFSASPLMSLEIDYRSPLICKELEAYNADIMCLQEVEDKIYNGILEPFLKISRNYRGIFSRKSGTVKEGVASFYNPMKLELLEYETVDIGTKMQTLPFFNVLPENLVKRIDERNTVVQIAAFENKNSEQSLLVLANTHLYFHPNADHIRLLQTMVCITSIEQKVAELKEKYPGRKIRTFFCGDFNCTPPYGAFRLLTTGKVTTDDDDWISYEPEKISPGINFEHGLKLSNSNTGQELTNIVVNFEGCIDYILYQPENVQVSNVFPVPSKSTIASLIGKPENLIALPTYYTPSDHLPVITDFKLL